MTTTLTPRLTPLDRRVLASLPARTAAGRRIFDTFRAPDVQRCPSHARSYGRGDDAGCPACTRALDAIADAYEEHCEVLRGLERVGLASCRGGWWRRT